MNTEPRPATLSDYQARILRVLVHIQNHLDDDLPLDLLAEIACFSPFHFHRVFKGMVGEGVAEHVRRLRLERAAHQLRFGDEPIVRVALVAGFQSHEAFTRAFAAMFGEPPSAFRDRHRAIAYPTAVSGVHYTADGRSFAFSPVGRKGVSAMEVEIERFPACRVAFVRHLGPYSEVGAAWGRLFAWAGPRRLVGPSLRYFGLCYDDPAVTAPERIRYDACLVVPPATEGDGDIGVQDVAGGEYATTVHVGPYESLGQAYEGLCGGWLPQSGRELGEPPCMEFYLNDPRTTPPDQLRTKVCMRLA
ncbi:MAG: AraC family transcriptional regulator [Planctomycetes bacterium]|nr:AraC family transcriptional regulator [Planctomycetota bacterium]